MKKLLFISLLFSSLANAQLGVFGVQVISSAPTYDTSYGTAGQFNMGGNSAGISGWVDFSNDPTGPAAIVKSATSNSITVSSNATTAWTAFGGNSTNTTVGENTDDGSGFAHNASAQRSGWYNYNDTYSGATSDACLKISGLTADSLYEIQLLPSADQGLLGYNSEMTAKMIDRDGTTTYTTYMDGSRNVGAVNPTTTGVVVTGNTSKYIRMLGRANASGFIFIWVGGTDNSSDAKRLGFVNTLKVRKATVTIH